MQDAVGQRTWLRAVLPESARALRGVPYGAGFATLVEEAGATEHEVALRILVLSADGGETRIESSRVLLACAAIDPSSSDLGTNARGLFVTYTARGRARVLGVEPRGVDRGHDTGPAPSGPERLRRLRDPALCGRGTWPLELPGRAVPTANARDPFESIAVRGRHVGCCERRA